MSNNETSQHHYLVTALGTSPTRTTYALGEGTEVAEHAPLALLKLLKGPDRPGVMVCLLTPTAKEKVWASVCRVVEGMDIKVLPIDIPEGNDAGEIERIVHSTARVVQRGSRVTLDVTHGPRHIPLVLYALALYLSTLKDVKIEAIWYGKFTSPDTTKPLINLGPLLGLPQWFYAIKLFRETGFTKSLARWFKAVEENLIAGPDRGPSNEVFTALNKFSNAYESGLPLELGLAAGRLCGALKKSALQDMPGLTVPLPAELGEAIAEAAEPFRFSQEALRDGHAKGEWKRTVALTKEELCRQAELIDRYIKNGQIGLAIGTMREWVVSLGLLYRGRTADWLKRDVRKRVEHELGTMSHPGARELLDEKQKSWGKFWDQLGKQRNQLAHCGMNQDVATPALDSIKDFWSCIKNANSAWPSFGGGSGRVLVTPLGLSPGVLYSAIRKTRPTTVVVLCSKRSQATLDHALQRAEVTGAREILAMQDPFGGFTEIADLVSRARTTLFGADEVLVNLTGGTTMMGIAAQRMFEQASDYQRPCRRFVLTDKRAADEQNANPWVEAELSWLDPAIEGGNENE